MAYNVIYWKAEGDTLYIRGDDQSGYIIWNISDYTDAPWWSQGYGIAHVSIETAIDVSTMRRWFINFTNLTDCNFTSILSVTDMSYCFSGCSKFNQPITIPSSVTDMSYCFDRCATFNQPITIPSSVTNMNSCFRNCIAFNSQVTFQSPSSVTDMSYCFRNCATFNQPITIPSSVTNMSYCFYICTAFNSQVTFQSPSSVTNMSSCFRNCVTFNQPITIPSSVTNMYYCFRNCDVFNSQVTFQSPSSVTDMGNCFGYCVTFNQPITIPSSVTNMSYCFYTCDVFNSQVTFQSPSSVTNMSSCFRNCATFNQPITIPSSVTNMRNCFSGCNAFNQPITLPSSVTNMYGCFSYCYAFNQSVICLTNFAFNNVDYIFESTTKQIYIVLIGDDACSGYNNWNTNVVSQYSNVSFGYTIPDNYEFEIGDYKYDHIGNGNLHVTAIDKTKSTYASVPGQVALNNNGSLYVKSMDSCFKNCINFDQTMNIPTGVESMISCFEGCSSLDAEITLPATVMYMNSCFEGCINFNQQIDIPSSVRDLSYCFDGCLLLNKQITIPYYTTAARYCFNNCRGLEVTPLFNALMIIDMTSCFCNCEKLQTPPVLPSTVLNMSSCFYGCSALTTAPVIPSGTTDMSACFYGCSALITAPAIPNSVTDMSVCFRDCSALTTAPVIPSSVVYMFSCFKGCSSLTNKVIINTNTDIFYFLDVFANTTPAIIRIAGTSAQLNAIASEYSNVYVYLPTITITSAERDDADDHPENAIVKLTFTHFRGEGDSLSSITLYRDNVSTAVTWYKIISPESVDYNTKNPQQEGWYEFDDGDFVASADTSVDVGKTYYKNNLVMDSMTETFVAVVPVPNENKSYELLTVVNDGYENYNSIIVTIPTNYYTIDFLRGGREIVFGLKAMEDDFYQELTTEPANWSTNWSDYYIKEDKKYKNATYELLPYAPLDWATDWTNYYIYSDGEYVHVTGSSAPTFEINTYYAEPLFSDNVYYAKRHDSLFKCTMDTAFNDMEPSEINDFISELDISGSPIELTQADWVVEQGTNGIWTWRKWQSGIAECWGEVTKSDITWSTYTALSNTMYYSSSNKPSAVLPFNITNPESFASVSDVGSNVGWVANTKVENNTVLCTIVRNGNSGDVTAKFFIKGRWK